jgi:hypothetical protein
MTREAQVLREAREIREIEDPCPAMSGEAEQIRKE